MILRLGKRKPPHCGGVKSWRFGSESDLHAGAFVLSGCAGRRGRSGNLLPDGLFGHLSGLLFFAAVPATELAIDQKAELGPFGVGFAGVLKPVHDRELEALGPRPGTDRLQGGEIACGAEKDTGRNVLGELPRALVEFGPHLGRDLNQPFGCFGADARRLDEQFDFLGFGEVGHLQATSEAVIERLVQAIGAGVSGPHVAGAHEDHLGADNDVAFQILAVRAGAVHRRQQPIEGRGRTAVDLVEHDDRMAAFDRLGEQGRSGVGTTFLDLPGPEQHRRLADRGAVEVEVREPEVGCELFGAGGLAATSGTEQEAVGGFALGEHLAADGDEKLKLGGRDEIGILGGNGEAGH